MHHEFIDIRVLGGLPITIDAAVAPAEPEIGIFHRYVDDFRIVAVAGRPCKNPDWIERRVSRAEVLVAATDALEY